MRDLSSSATGTTYLSSNSGVVTADIEGRLTAVGNGTATVTVTNSWVNAFASVRVAAESDLAIQQTASPSPVTPGADLTYAIAVTNQGQTTARDVQVESRLPADSLFVSASGDGWGCIEAGGRVYCSRDSLAAGAAATLNLVIQTLASCQSIDSRVAVNASSPDGNADNNVSIVTTPCAGTNFVLTLAKSGTGSGTVSGGGTYSAGAPVTLNATADAGSTFAGWSPSPCAATFTMPAGDLTCTATFTLNSNTYALTLAKAGFGSGTVSGDGPYTAGSTVHLTAIPDATSAFAGWGPAPCAASFTMPASNLTCSATFSRNSLGIKDVSLGEGNTGTTTAAFVVTLSPASGRTVTVAYATANGTATAGSDYTAANGTLSLAAGETSKTVSIPVRGDTTREANETFYLNLSAPTGAILSDAQGLGTILNDDGPILRIGDVSKAEGQAGTTAFVFPVTLSPASTGTVTVKYATVAGTAQAGSDFTAASGTLTFSPGQTSKTVTVNVAGDTVAEPNETFTLNLSVSASSGATLLDSQGLGTILNDDGPILRIGDVSKAEGQAGTTAFVFPVTLSPASTGAVTVKYATVPGTAQAGSDFTAASGSLTFAPGQTSKTVTVNVTGDTVAEPNETFILNLSASTGATLFDSQGLGTIINDDGPVLRIGDASKAEGNAGTTAFVFPVTLSPASTGTVTVKYATVPGTAQAGSDYAGTSGTLTFSPGLTSKTVTVNVKGETAAEPNETFSVNLSKPTGATLFDSQGLGTILNDDGPVLRVGDVNKAEGQAGTTAFNFPVTLSPASTGTVTVKYATVPGTAQAGSDFAASSGTLTFTPGQRSKTVTVNVTGDTVAEPNENFALNLSVPTGATLFDAQGLGTIVNDD